MSREICAECNQKYTKYDWCKPCNSKRFQNDFNNWTSGNDKIDKGEFGTIHYAKWIDGFMDIENQQWEDRTQITSIRFYKITLDPETNKYIMVLEYAEDGNLREYLKTNFNNINLKQKLRSLRELSLRLMNIHKLDIVHQDFHPGNILSTNFKSSTFIKISDFGLSKIIKENPNDPEKKNIFGVLPYIAPEVLSGEKEYTKATHVYSFGIITYEKLQAFLHILICHMIKIWL
ncbi:hypothetical protein Glove_689g12 [Diversispora epigaea]|uniref:Protein kinase domain-containing protein n=1 Tax=Diversispora epigaea TaxID=1348612 RepID=A0A397G4Z4_9GLOM|nr:hypothetical protein Glove_689g12 [Diversispora epigaea]